MWIDALVTRWPWRRPTVRLRLTLLYGALFLLAGALLLLTSYVLVRRDLDQALAVPKPSRSTGQAVPSAAAQLAIVKHNLRTDVIHQLLGHSAMAWGVMALTSVWLCWWAAGRALRPVQQVTATARRLSESSLHERIALTGPQDELQEMADSFDAMLDRLEVSFEGQRRFVANASHELRTPLAIQRTLLEVALDDPTASASELRHTMEEVIAVTSRSEHLVDNLLVLARSARGQSLQEKEEIDLAEVARLAIDQEWCAGGQPDLTLNCRLAPATVTASKSLLGHLAANLVQNAIRHNRAGAWIEVATESVGGRASLTVRNSGRAIPPEHVDQLFEPFSRLGVDRTVSDREPHRGCGLGLSIVRAVAEMHGATVTAVAPEAGGLSVTVEFSAARTGPRSAPVAPARGVLVQ